MKIIDLHIPGLNTQNGMQNSGGAPEDYCDILAIYAADNENRLAEMKKHYRAGDIAALTICLHAVKSASANIGAESIASMAAKLESCGTLGDIQYINANLQPLFDSISALLSDILEFLRNHMEKAVVKDKPADVVFLKNALAKISALMEDLDFDAVEKILSELYTYNWNKDVFLWLLKLKSCIAIFDYDGIEAVVATLKAICGIA